MVDCSRREGASSGAPAAPAPAPSARPVGGGAPVRGSTRLLSWAFPDQEPERAAVVVPAWGSSDARFPTVLALHGRGEALKAPAEGAMGWPRDYELVRAIRRLCAPPLTKDDFEGLVDDATLAADNQALATAPFRGVLVACPYVPDLDLHRAAPIEAFGRFLLDVLVPRLRAQAPALDSPAATGIDGVSLGGAVALHVGLAHPLAFGAVGAIQPAIVADDVSLWTERALAARQKNPRLKLRLLTSEDDFFRDAITRTSKAWALAGVDHEFGVARGPHDYVFNRGPGSIELLRWHDAALARR
jgi:hypothetical protein